MLHYLIKDYICMYLAAYSGVRLSFYAYYISAIDVGLLWAVITYVKSCSMALNFWLQRNMKKIFQMKY